MNELNPYIKDNTCSISLSDNDKIYIEVKKEILDEFQNKFGSKFHLDKYSEYNYNEAQNGKEWFAYEYLPAYDASYMDDPYKTVLQTLCLIADGDVKNTHPFIFMND